MGYKAEYYGFANGGVGINEALTSGNLDVAFYGDFPAINYIASGNDAQIFGVVTSRQQSSILARDGINSVQDLKGKKVATAQGTIQQKYLDEVLEENGLQPSDVASTYLVLGTKQYLEKNEVVKRR